jgi:hypothetical protein
MIEKKLIKKRYKEEYKLKKKLELLQKRPG